MKTLRFCGLVILLMWGTASAQTADLSLPDAAGISGSPVTIPVALNTSAQISGGQVVVEYGAGLQFDGATIGPDVHSSIAISNINIDLPFAPSASGATDNVLVQFSSTGGSVTGSVDILLLQFSVVGAPGSTSPLAFDRGPDRTSLTTSDRITLFGDDLNFVDGQLSVLPAGAVEIRVRDVTADPGTNIFVPVRVSTDRQIGALQVTVDYNSNVLTFDRVDLGSDAAGFTITVNTNLPFPPASSNTNANLLVQISGGGRM